MTQSAEAVQGQATLEPRYELRDVAERYGRHHETIRVWVRKGILGKPMKIGGRLFFTPAQLDEMERAATR